jgi:hypothetical protein
MSARRTFRTREIARSKSAICFAPQSEYLRATAASSNDLNLGSFQGVELDQQLLVVSKPTDEWEKSYCLN